VTEKEIRRFYDITAEDYISEHGGTGENADIINFLELLPESARLKILDIGCAHGINTGMFSSSRYVGIDISGKLIETAKRCYPRHCFIQANAVRLPIQNGSCSGVFCSISLCHLTEDDFFLALTEVGRVLIPKGIFLLVMPYPYEEVCVQNRISSYADGTPYTLRLYSLELTKKKLMSVGFNYLDVTNYGPGMYFALFAEKN
jgi:SAM-dependent methyltransferase